MSNWWYAVPVLVVVFIWVMVDGKARYDRMRQAEQLLPFENQLCGHDDDDLTGLARAVEVFREYNPKDET